MSRQKEPVKIIMWQLYIKGLEGKTHTVNIKASNPEVGGIHGIIIWIKLT